MKFRDRVKELRRVSPAELRDNPRNWHVHGPIQAAALREMLEKIGVANAVLARECADGGLELIDGHLRKSEMPADAEVPVLVLDVNESEAAELLATMDTLGGMAGVDPEKIESLVSEIEDLQADIHQQLLDVSADVLKEEKAPNDKEQGAFGPEPPQSAQLRPDREYVVVVCNDAKEWDELKEKLGLRAVRRGGYRRGSQFDAIGTERVIPASRLLEAIKNGDSDTEQGAGGADYEPQGIGNGDVIRAGERSDGI